ncbi:hypothetical protein [Ligilactobacillus acidipiscis]|jgi:succinyl-diaminopimelate desuccinylase|nr:hypothetical protein [Ligilactobacillus acidipiscis]
MGQKKKINILNSLVEINSVNGNEAKVADYITTLFSPYNDRIKI